MFEWSIFLIVLIQFVFCTKFNQISARKKNLAYCLFYYHHIPVKIYTFEQNMHMSNPTNYSNQCANNDIHRRVMNCYKPRVYSLTTLI